MQIHKIEHKADSNDDKAQNCYFLTYILSELSARFQLEN